ncbi:MAG: NINE protein [Pyrinomonadaceae bacterium]
MDYYIYKDDQNLGPLSEREVSDGLRSGRFLSDDLGCRVGEDRWVDLDFFFPNMTNQAHTWIEPQNVSEPRFANPPAQPAPRFENSGLQRPLGRQTSQQIDMHPPTNQGQVYQQPAYVVQPIIIGANKSRVSYVLLGIFLGGLGIHNFYAGYSGRGVAQLLLTLFLFWTIVVPIVVWIWVIIEVISVDRDAYGNRFS